MFPDPLTSPRLGRSSQDTPAGPGASVSLSLAERVHFLCRRFEDALRAGVPPALEDFLAGTAGAERAELLRELLCLELDHRTRAGDTPTADEYRARFPQDGAIIEAAFAETFAA